MPAVTLPDRDRVVVRHILERHAAEQPDGVCAQFDDATIWTWRDAHARMCAAASALASRGVGRGDRVLIMQANGARWLEAWWGVTGMGATMVPLHTAYRGEMLRHICTSAEATAIVADPSFGDRLDEIGSDVPRIDPAEFDSAVADPAVLGEQVEPWDIATINYTSGTTGPAKGVITPHLQTYWGGHDVFGAPAGLTAQDRWLVDLPLFHVAAQQITVAALSTGASIAVRAVFSGSDYWSVVRDAGATFALLAGTMGGFLRQQPARGSDRGHGLRVMVAAPLPADHEEFLARFGVSEMVTAYGSTETGAPTIGYSRDSLPAGTCGRPRQGIELRIVDHNDLEVPAGETGELVMRTHSPWELNQGYHNDPASTARAWRNGWFHTGDSCCRDDEGWYYFRDRLTDTLRRRGEMISSFHVESEVAAHSDVAEAACVAAPGELGEDEVKIFVVPAPGVRFDAERLIIDLAERLPYFMVPRYVEVVDELPKTRATSRVQKQELRARGHGSTCWDREKTGIIVGRTGLHRAAT
jgi:crotonobetaine/carnitine-CoA ligase